ncbi:MAG: B12-binding domain-containing radical SAM protein [Candidatus Omnitrophica bacterium]|nr:B12-binding domain-containing radical SAM protein [Candidatus Omnitrophota bacterium]MBU1925360.1 B12-binding domain-containing radical SAM protein [Candidatus Omnitrophota bacterium]
MRFNKILLLNPPYSGSRVNAVFCAGLGYIAQALKASGIEYDVLDMSLGYSYPALKEKIRKFTPDLIGISLMTYGYKESYALIGRIKKDFPDIRTVAGGAHISLFREKVLEDCAGLDFGVVLEGEKTIIELCQGENPDSIKGLILRKDTKAVYNADRSFIEDLDAIPFPQYERFELDKVFDKKVNALPIVSSRGCPFDCVYCPVKYAIGEKFRVRSAENVIEELSYWYAKGYCRFSFADDNFTLAKDRVEKICHELIKSKMHGLKLSCDNGIRADCVDKELLVLMKQAGFYRIAFGVEAGNDKVLKMLKKRESIAVLKERIQQACALGYDVDLFFLVGSPGETERDLQDSFDIALKYPIGTAYFYNIIPFPNTELFGWIEKNGRFIIDPAQYLDKYPILDNEPVFETDEMPYAARKKALTRAFKIMRMTMQRSWARRLTKWGVVGKVLAGIYTSTFMQDVILRNRFTRKLVYNLAKACFS